MLGGIICRWFFLLEDFEFEVIFKPCKHNVDPIHLSRIESREVGHGLDDELPDRLLFRVEAIPNQLVEIAKFLTTGQALTDYTQTQCRQLVTCSADY